MMESCNSSNDVYVGISALIRELYFANLMILSSFTYELVKII